MAAHPVHYSDPRMQVVYMNRIDPTYVVPLRTLNGADDADPMR